MDTLKYIHASGFQRERERESARARGCMCVCVCVCVSWPPVEPRPAHGTPQSIALVTLI